MAFYGDIADMTLSEGPAFKSVFSPGDTVATSGIYSCRACGLEIVSTHGNTLPPHGHHVHDHPVTDPITWRLVCAPENRQAADIGRLKVLSGLRD